MTARPPGGLVDRVLALDGPADPVARHVLLVLATHAGPDDHVELVDAETLAHETGLPFEFVLAALSRLDGYGLLSCSELGVYSFPGLA